MSDPAWSYANQGLVIPLDLLEGMTEDEQTRIQRHSRNVAWHAHAERIGVPPGLSIVGDADDIPTSAMDAASLYMTERFSLGGCLVFAGPTGTGKSYAAVSVLRKAGRVESRFWYFPALCGLWLDPERRRESLEYAKDVYLAVFDDFGVEYVKEGGLVDAFLDELIWYREAHTLPTIITTNLTSDQLRNRMPPRLVDRLRGKWGRIVACNGESLRG